MLPAARSRFNGERGIGAVRDACLVAGCSGLRVRSTIRTRSLPGQRAINAAINEQGRTIMTEPTPPAGDEPSRRDIVAAAVTIAAAAGAAGTPAQAQTPSHLRFSNPPGMSSPPTYSHLVEVTGPHRTVYIAGQTGADAKGNVPKDFRGQAVQVMENIKAVLDSVGGGFEHVVRITSYLTDIAANATEFRDVRALYFKKDTLPTATLLQVVRLANPAYLLEVEAIAVLPAKG